MKTNILCLWICIIVTAGSAQQTGRQDLFLDTLEHRTAQWFLDVTPRQTGLTPDRYPTLTFSSVAAIGFALTTYGIAAERNYITRADAVCRTLTTLRYLINGTQGSQVHGVMGYHGFFYHFLNFNDGSRFKDVELSTIDTALLIAGVLFSESYFDRNNSDEKEIRAVADSLYRRIDWNWAMFDTKGVVMGWDPEKGRHRSIWRGYNEAMILYILALGSPTHPVPESVWDAWTSTYHWGEYYGQEYLNFMPLFGHQYSHAWIDFKGIQDSYMRSKGIDYFENSRRAVIVHRAYAAKNPNHWRGYSDSVWGMTACDGPKDTSFVVDGIRRDFRSYSARGTAANEHVDDGTLAPTSVGGSIPFAPKECIDALKTMRTVFSRDLWTKYGFKDAFNLTYVTPSTPNGWFDDDYLGIDQGPIVMMVENYRSGLVWNTMKKNPYIVKGLRRAGFQGGWLDSLQHTH